MPKRGFVRTPEGMYRVRGLIRPEEIVNVASQILYQDLSERESLTRPADAAKFLHGEVGCLSAITGNNCTVRP